MGYQRTLLVHELSTAFIHHYSGYSKWAGWFVQGLEQYEGLMADGTLWHVVRLVWWEDTVAGRRGREGEHLLVSEEC